MYVAKRQQVRWYAGLYAIVFVVSSFLLGTVAVNAQTPTTPITIGENKTGEIADVNGSAVFTIQVAAPMSINVQVLAITPNFAPRLRVIDPASVVILDSGNSGTATVAGGSPNLASTGEYQIEVTGVDGAAGQFLISVQPGAPFAPPQLIMPGQAVDGTVDAQTTRQAYAFTASQTGILLLTIHSTDPASNPTVALRDANSDETLALSSARLAGLRYRIPAGEQGYLLEITHSGGTTAEGFSLCLEMEDGSTPCAGGSTAATTTPVVQVVTALPTATLTPPSFGTPTPFVIDPNGSCMVAVAGSVTVNVRSGPGTNYNILTGLQPNSAAPVYGRLPDNTWFQVNVNGQIGWVSASVVQIGGNCGGVPVVQPPTPQYDLTATANAQITQAVLTATANGQMDQSLMTATASAVQATANAIATATANAGGGNNGGNGGGNGGFRPPIAQITLIAPIQVNPINPKLNYQGSANYGEANLSAGFSPDPYSVGMLSGGAVDVSYLGGSCSGFATSNPDLRINFGGGGASLLRIYFVGANGDAAIVVNDPYGNFYCVDDSFGTVNPTIDFNNPAGGAYDVWVASNAGNTSVSGTLYITENSGNHP